MNETRIRTLSAGEVETRLIEFGVLLHACVHTGANVNFVLPFSEADAEVFWVRKVLPALRNGKRVLWIAEQGDRLAGSVQLDYDTPPNQAHRAEVTKLLVHPDFRRRGIGRALMRELEARANLLGRTLITLDTRTGDYAEPLYASLGYETAGIIPDFCRDPIEDRMHPTTIMYKALRPAA